MIDVINNIQQSLPLLLLRGGVLLAIAFSAAFLLRRRAQHVRIVWATATLLLLALPMLQPLQVWHLPTVDLVTEKVPAPIAIPAPTSPAGEMRIEPLPAVSVSIPVDDTVKPPTETSTTAAPQEITPREARPWLPLLWLAGACLGLAYLALGRVVLWRLRTRREPANTPWLESLAAVGKETGISVGGRIFFVPGIGMPLTAGIFSPEIWLPESARDFGSRHRSSVLRHELAHIRGRDALWQLLSSLALASQWMNPMAWVAARSFRLAQERVCDDLALGAEDAAGEEYAHLLLEVARNAAHQTDFRMTYAPTLMMAKNSSLKKRMKLILDKNMKRTAITKRQAWLTAALATALGLPMSLIGFAQESPLPGKAAQDPAPRSEPSDDGAALLKRKMAGIARNKGDVRGADPVDMQNYIDAEREFETERALLDESKLKLITEEITLGTYGDTVIIHDSPVIAEAPVAPNVMPKQYESSVTVEPRQGGGMPPIVLGAELEIIKSENVLSKVIDSLDLINRWGLDRETALRILKEMIQTENIKGTHLIQIRVRHTNNKEARDIAAEVAESYRDYRKELVSKPAEKGILELKKAVREQEDRVEEKRKILTTMALIGSDKKSPLPGEAAQDPAPRIEPSDDGAALLKRKMAGITIPEITMNNASLAEALDFLHKSSIPQDAADSGKGGNGIDFVLLKSALPDSREPLLNELKKAVRDQKDKVEERRKILLTLARAKDIIPRMTKGQAFSQSLFLPFRPCRGRSSA